MSDYIRMGSRMTSTVIINLNSLRFNNNNGVPNIIII